MALFPAMHGTPPDGTGDPKQAVDVNALAKTAYDELANRDSEGSFSPFY
jgi:hypothetical protein